MFEPRDMLDRAIDNLFDSFICLHTFGGSKELDRLSELHTYILDVLDVDKRNAHRLAEVVEILMETIHCDGRDDD